MNTPIKAFKVMMKNRHVSFTEKGKSWINDAWDNASDDVWHIKAVNSNGTVSIVSENHLIMEDADLDWFIEF